MIDAARKRDWTKLPEMLVYIPMAKDRDEVFATSLIRLISPVQDQKVLPALLIAAKDPSPLVRAAAIQALGLGAGHGKSAGPGRSNRRRVPAGEGPGCGRDRGIPADVCTACLSGAAREGEPGSILRP
ncbi:MAG: HEAT repeat domain-containing protein [Desulfobacterales bacterium]|nr:HEAT repeat domain-containing protein [Desulfobacterales bacterium]